MFYRFTEMPNSNMKNWKLFFTKCYHLNPNIQVNGKVIFLIAIQIVYKGGNNKKAITSFICNKNKRAVWENLEAIFDTCFHI